MSQERPYNRALMRELATLINGPSDDRRIAKRKIRKLLQSLEGHITGADKQYVRCLKTYRSPSTGLCHGQEGKVYEVYSHTPRGNYLNLLFSSDVGWVNAERFEYISWRRYFRELKRNEGKINEQVPPPD